LNSIISCRPTETDATNHAPKQRRTKICDRTRWHACVSRQLTCYSQALMIAIATRTARSPKSVATIMIMRYGSRWAMTVITDDFYRSSNGDRWQLLRDTASGRRVVRHEPNLASGGQVTETSVDEFLARTGTSPENIALKALLAKHEAADRKA